MHRPRALLECLRLLPVSGRGAGAGFRPNAFCERTPKRSTTVQPKDATIFDRSHGPFTLGFGPTPHLAGPAAGSTLKQPRAELHKSRPPYEHSMKSKLQIITATSTEGPTLAAKQHVLRHLIMPPLLQSSR